MPQPRWSGIHADLVILKPEPNIDIGDMAGETIDRRKVPYLEDVLLGSFGCKLEPTDEFEVKDDFSVAQIWKISKEE